MTIKAVVPRGPVSEGDRLVHEGLPILRVVVRRLMRRLGGRVDADELFAIGQEALVEIARSFDPQRGSFPAYATLKLKWAIFDGLRRQTGGRAGRSLALAASERVVEALSREQPAGELPTEDSQRERLRSLLDAQAAALATGLLAAEPNDESSSPEEQAQREQLARALRGAVGDLPPRERELVDRHYFGGEQFDAIAQDLGISKSWASRLHGQAMLTLGRALRDLR